MESLILSDVIGDDLSSIASGPTAPDPTTFEDVAAILGRYSLTTEVPGAVRRRVEQGVRGEIADTPSEGDPVFDRVINRLVGTNSRSLEAAGQRAAEMGFQSLVLTEPLLGEARGAPAVFQEALLRHGHQKPATGDSRWRRDHGDLTWQRTRRAEPGDGARLLHCTLNQLRRRGAGCS